jgi:hypothetical protein
VDGIYDKEITEFKMKGGQTKGRGGADEVCGLPKQGDIEPTKRYEDRR